MREATVRSDCTGPGRDTVPQGKPIRTGHQAPRSAPPPYDVQYFNQSDSKIRAADHVRRQMGGWAGLFLPLYPPRPPPPPSRRPTTKHNREPAMRMPNRRRGPFNAVRSGLGRLQNPQVVLSRRPWGAALHAGQSGGAKPWSTRNDSPVRSMYSFCNPAILASAACSFFSRMALEAARSAAVRWPFAVLA